MYGQALKIDNERMGMSGIPTVTGPANRPGVKNRQPTFKEMGAMGLKRTVKK